jgi:hypothetical protein
MPKLQHETRRGGPGTGEIVLVNGVKYELDAAGVVEVPEEAAAKMLQGPSWRSLGHWAGKEAVMAAATPPVTNGARPARTKEQLAAAAAEAGIEVSKPAEPKPEPTPVVAAEPAAAEPAGDEEEIEISEDMSKSELMEVARKVGLTVAPSMTKAQIITLLEQQAT